MEKEGFRWNGRKGKDKGAYPLIDDTRGPGFQGQGRESASLTSHRDKSSWDPRLSRCCCPTFCAPLLDRPVNLGSPVQLVLRFLRSRITRGKEKKKRKKRCTFRLHGFSGRKKGKPLSLCSPCVNFSMIGEYFEDTFTLSRGIRLTRRVQGGKKRFLLLELRQNTRTAATAATITVHNYRLRELNTSVGNTRPRRGL